MLVYEVNLVLRRLSDEAKHGQSNLPTKKLHGKPDYWVIKQFEEDQAVLFVPYVLKYS